MGEFLQDYQGKSLGKYARPIALGVVFFTAALVYFNSLNNGFVADDRYIVLENLSQSENTPLLSLFKKPWAAGSGSDFEDRMNQGYYRPLSMMLIRIENRWFGTSSFGYHAVSVLLHMVVCGLVFLLSTRWLSTSGAFICGFIFAIHSVHTEVVDVIFYQTTLLVTGFTLLSLFIYSMPKKGLNNSLIKQAAVVLLFGLALFCKETAIIIPLLLILYDVFFRQASLKIVISPFFLLLAAIGVGYLVLRMQVLGNGGFSYFEDIPVWSRIVTMCDVFFMYIKLCIWPYPLCPFYEWTILPPIEDPFCKTAVLGVSAALVYLISIVLIVRRWGRNRFSKQATTPYAIVGFALCFFLSTLLPVLHFAPILNVAAERFIYLGSFSYCLLFGLLFQYLLQRKWRSILKIATIVILCVYGLFLITITVVRNEDWFSNESLNRATLKEFPNSLSARIALSKILIEQAKYKEALYHARAASKIAPFLSAPKELVDTANKALNSRREFTSSHKNTNANDPSGTEPDER